MALFASAVSSQNDHGYEAGRYVANHILAAFQKPPALLIASISDRYDVAEVARGIRSIEGTSSIPLIGSSSPAAITLAGMLDKGVGVLALRSDELRPQLALETGLQSQPGAAAQRVLDQLQAYLPTAKTTTPAALLMFTSSPGGTTAVEAALQALHAQGTNRAMLCGIAAGTTSSSGNARVFVNDQTMADSLAVGLMHTAIGVGLAQGTDATLPQVATNAARQAVAALGTSQVAAALIVESMSTAVSTAEDDLTTAVIRIREVIGRATPFVGMSGLGVIGPQADPVAVHQKAVVVCVFG